MTKTLILCILFTMTLVDSSSGNERRVHQTPLDRSSSDADILELAARVVPSPRQMTYLQEGFIGFIHFGPNTFTGREWGNGKEDPTVFAPRQVDTDQWCEVMKAAGMKKVIITVKHHDGYCTWQTRYNTTFSVHRSPWEDGNGDVLQLVSDSCRKYGLRLGVYLSPADLYQMESETGLYGDGSSYEDTIIPTHPESFRTDPTRPRDVPAGLPTFQVKTDHYNRYFMNQLYELLTDYGPIHEVWFDGAHPKRKGDQKYMKEAWYRMVRALAPEAVIFGGPDVRWCGNEQGATRDSEWNVLPVSSLGESGVDRPATRIGDDASLLKRSYEVYGTTYTPNFLFYMVAEVDTSLRHGWFWRNEHEQQVRGADEMFDIYERSVGGNAVFLLNVPPTDQGRFGERDESVLRDLGQRIRSTYDTDLAAGLTSDAPGLDDDDIETYWQPHSERGAFTVQLPARRTINRIVLQEAVSAVGQRVKEHALDAWVDGEWQEITRATTIGYKRILRFPDITCDRFRVRILASREIPTVAHFSAHHYAPPSTSMLKQENPATGP